jgi:hypothetical protein
MPFITPQDFKDGVITLAVTKLTEDRLQIFIDTFQKNYLQDLLGCELYDLYIADLNGTGDPQTQRFIDIYNAFCLDEDKCQRQVRSIGIFEMNKRFIYFEWERQNKTKNSQTGPVVNQNEVSREADFSEAGLYRIYNEAVKTYQAIEWFICDNLTVYPEYNGINKKKTSWL